MRRISWIDQGMRSDVLALRSTWFFWARCLRAHPSGFTTLVAKQPVHEQASVQSCALLREQRTHPYLHFS